MAFDNFVETPLSHARDVIGPVLERIPSRRLWHVKIFHASLRNPTFFIVEHNEKTYFTLRESVRNIYKLRKSSICPTNVVYHNGENTGNIELYIMSTKPPENRRD
jgi:hypothetical protein